MPQQKRKYSWKGFNENLSPSQALLAYQIAVKNNVPIQTVHYAKFDGVFDEIARIVGTKLPEEKYKPDGKDIESLLRHISREGLEEDDLRE